MRSNLSERKKKRDLRKETIAVLVEEAEGFLELGDLLVGELIGHWIEEKRDETMDLWALCM